MKDEKPTAESGIGFQPIRYGRGGVRLSAGSRYHDDEDGNEDDADTDSAKKI